MLDLFSMELLKALDEDSVVFGADMSRYTTIGCGGKASALVKIDGLNAVTTVLSLAKKYEVPYAVLGNGSNVLFDDEGFHGVVLHMTSNKGMTLRGANRIEVMSGESLRKICRFSAKCGLGGLEFCYGIPATLGGAIAMNAGAFNRSFSELIESVVCVEDGRVKVMTPDACCFSYRDSVFKRGGKVILSAILRLEKSDEETVLSVMKQNLSVRKKTQPLDIKSFGSIFKNPLQGRKAWELISECGLRRYSQGGACLSQMHCNFIENGGSCSSNILLMIEHIKSTVEKKYGIILEEEFVRIGDPKKQASATESRD